jgi:three-Cys-motif partner protein
MKNVQEIYTDREHSWIKHLLLTAYLEKVLSIIGAAGFHREITYVDCFAGPWGDKSEDLSGTSISISLAIVKRVRQMFLERGQTIKFRVIYIEKKRASFARLKQFLETHCPPEIDAHALHGDYVDQQDEILRLSGGSFCFFFVDPLGWTPVAIPKMTKLLQRPQSEFLINFMYDFINRAIGMEDLQKQVQETIGPWRADELEQLKAADSKTRADLVVRKYRYAVKEVMQVPRQGKPRSYHLDILKPKVERVHYHLVYLTRHPKGIWRFAEASQAAELEQAEIRFEARQRVSGQSDLFALLPDPAARHSAYAGVEEVKAYLLTRLSKTPTVFGEEQLADMLEETGWRLDTIENAFKELIRNGQVRNLSANALRRRKHFVHFDKNERLALPSNG